MKVNINEVKVATRIRKQTANIEELAGDIKQNGLINPITVMSVSGGGYQLLAGLRRLRAARELGWSEIEATVVPPKGAEEALKIEYSENEQRESFTYSEKMDYARLIAEIEKAKAKERMLAGEKTADPVVHGPQGTPTGRSRDIIGKKIGMSGRQYERAKYVADRASPEIIDEIDCGKRSIRSTYDKFLSDDKKTKNANIPISAPETVREKPGLQESDLERAIHAERELDAMKYRQHNEIFHRDSIIENLKKRVAELESELEAANARIKELEEYSNEETKTRTL